MFETSHIKPFDQLIITPSFQLKQWIYDTLFHFIGQEGQDQRGISYPTVMTLDEWVETCFGYGCFFEKGFEKLILKKTVQTVLSDPTYHASFYRSNGFLQALHQLMRFMCQHDLRVRDLEDQLKNGLQSSLPVIRPYLEPLLKEYITRKEKLGIFTTDDYYRSTVENGFLYYFEKLHSKSIFWVGFFEAIPLKMKIIQKMIALSDISYMLLVLPPSFETGNSNLFYEWIQKNGWAYEEILPQLSMPISWPNIKVVSLDTYDEEVRYLASYIHTTLEQDSTLSLNDFAIICPNKDSYKLSLKKTFSKYHLPLSLFDQTPLSQTPFGVFLDHLWDLILSQDERVLLIRFLKSPFISDMQIGNQVYPIDADFIKKVSLELRIKKDAKQWLGLWEGHPTSFEDKLQNHYQILDTLFGLLQKIRLSTSLSEFLRHLKELFMTFQLDQKLSYFQEVLELIRQLEIFYSLQDDFKFHLESVILDFQLLFSTHFSFLNDSEPDGILVLEKIESFGIHKKYLMICGFIQGNWPGTETQDLFIFSQLRRQAQTELLITYPKTDGDQPLLVSYFMDLLGPDISIQHGSSSPNFEEDRFIEIGRTLRQTKTPTPKMDDFLVKRYRAYEASLDQGYRNSYWGCFDSGVLKQSLTAYTQAPFSVTRLETYQNCPYRFFFKYLLKEEGEEDFTQDIAAQIWGSMIHQIWYRFYLESNLPRDWSQHQTLRDKAKQNLVRISLDILDTYSEDTLYWDAKKNLLIGGTDQVGLIDLFIQQEEDSFFSLQPTVFEESFMFPVYHTQHHTLELTLTGKIDAILTQPDSPFFAIMDYKTGSTIPDYSEIERFESLQLPIYMLVKKKQLGDLQLAGGVIYQIKDQNHFEKKILCVTELAKEHQVFSLGRKRPFCMDDLFFEKLTDHLICLKNMIADGFFGFVRDTRLPDTSRSVCRYCAYVYFCRYSKKFARY